MARGGASTTIRLPSSWRRTRRPAHASSWPSFAPPSRWGAPSAKRSRARNLLPPEPLQTLDDEVTTTQENFDTRVRVALRPGTGPEQPIVGDVMAIGGFLRKCYVFDFSTEVAGAADEPALSSRLAFARTRILGGLALDSFGQVPRQEPSGPIGGAPR